MVKVSLGYKRPYFSIHTQAHTSCLPTTQNPLKCSCDISIRPDIMTHLVTRRICSKIKLYWRMVLFCGLVLRQGLSLCVLDCLGTCYVDQVSLNSQLATCLCLPSSGTKGMSHHAWQGPYYWWWEFVFPARMQALPKQSTDGWPYLASSRTFPMTSFFSLWLASSFKSVPPKMTPKGMQWPAKWRQAEHMGHQEVPLDNWPAAMKQKWKFHNPGLHGFSVIYFEREL